MPPAANKPNGGRSSSPPISRLAKWPSVFADGPLYSIALPHCDIIETGNDGWRFKSRV